MEDSERKIFVSDVNSVNLQEHTYCQVQGESIQNGCKMEPISDDIQIMDESELLTENFENSSNLNKNNQSEKITDYTGKIISGESCKREKNIFQNVGDMCADADEQGSCVGDLNTQNITMNWTPATHSFKRKSHKSYLATWSAQISCDGFAKCLIETCNFISLDLPTMQDHYKTCNGIPNYDFNTCGSCSSWLPTSNELIVHESKCKRKKKDTSTTLPQSKDLNEAKTNQSEIKDESHISSASPQGTSCRGLSVEASGEMPNEERQMKYCDECDIEFLSDTDFSQHLICKKNWRETLPVDEKKREATRPVAKTSKKKVVDDEHIVQPWRPLIKGQYVRRRSFTKQHKIAWEAAIKKHKYVKCIFQNCHFLALSLEDMIYHYGYCNGDGNYAQYECHFCRGRLTKKKFLDIHVEKSHASRLLNGNNFRSMEFPNEESQLSPVTDTSESSESSGNGMMCFGEYDPDFPQEAPLEVEIAEESTCDWQEEAPFEESIKEEEVETSYDLEEDDKSNIDFQIQEWETAFGGSQDSTGVNNSRYTVVKELKSVLEDNHGHFTVDTSQDNLQKICSDRDYTHDHIYSKVKIRTIPESESTDSLSVKKKKILKHYPSKKHANEGTLRMKREETVSEKEGDRRKEVKEELTFNETVPVLDTIRKKKRKIFVIPSASQKTFKREILPYYTSMWSESLQNNRFARCLVATCNFISLDLFHIQNHFKTCNGIPENGPNFCTFCESRLPSSVELELHKSMCKANGEIDTWSRYISQTSGECNTDTFSENRTGESSSAGERRHRRKLREYNTREESCSFNSDKDATEGEISPRKENTNSLRIGEIIKLKNKEIVDHDPIIQPGPALPEGQYLRRRSYSKTHKAAWEAALEKHKYVKCLFQNCHFLAMSLEDMIYHFGYCIGDGTFAEFECPHCGGRLTSQAVLDIHIERSHPSKLRDENDSNTSGNDLNTSGNDLNTSGNDLNTSGNDFNTSGNDSNTSGNDSNTSGNDSNTSGNDSNASSSKKKPEVIIYSLDEWRNLMSKKEPKTYSKNPQQLSIVVLEAQQEDDVENVLRGRPGDCSSPDNPSPLPEEERRIRTGSEEEVDGSSDVNNSTSDSKDNICDSSAENQTPTNIDCNNTHSEVQSSPARKPLYELRPDEKEREETPKKAGSPTNRVRATGKAKSDDLVEMPGKGDVLEDTSDNQGTPERACKTEENFNISSEKKNPRTPEKPNDEQKTCKGNPAVPVKPNDEQKACKGNPTVPVKPNDEQKISQGNPRTPENPNDKGKGSHRNPRIPEKPSDEQQHSRGNAKTPEKSTDEQKTSQGNPRTPENPNDKGKGSRRNPRIPVKSSDEQKTSTGDPMVPVKPNDERQRSHGNASTSSLVLEKNSNAKKQETEKERISLKQNTKTENKNSNKSDEETKHDMRLRRKRDRNWKSLDQEDLSEEEHVEEVLDDSDAKGTTHGDTQKPRSKVTKTEPSKSESNAESNPTSRKRGRPSKSTSLRCKGLGVETKEVMEEMTETPKRGGNSKKRKSEAEENRNSNNVKCANCGFESPRRLFTDHNHKKHAGLSWIEGEDPIDLNDEDAVSWNVKQAFKHIKSATCGKCGSVKKSALGFISHVQNCGKSEEEKAALKVKCPHCPARILKYSLPMHLKLSHFEPEGKKPSQENVSAGELPLKRKSALRAVNKFGEVLRQENDEEETKKKGQFVVYEKGVSKFPKLPAKTRSLWMKMIKEKKKIPCRRGSCLTESSSVQEAKNHHFLCSELPPKCYVCERCDFFSESKTVIQQHVDIHPTVDADYKLESEEEKSEEETDVKDAEDEESELIQTKSKTPVTSSDDTALEASLKARFFAREGLLNERQMRFCRRSLRMTLESEIEEVKKYSPVFPELYTQASDWIHVKPENATDHFPSLDESISFRVNNTKKKSGSDWKKIKRFTGEIVEDSAVIFTGGSILSMSWCKYSCLRSPKQNPKQYLAVSSSRKMEKFQNIHEEHGDAPSMIQIYDCGEMKIFNDVGEVPKMVMGIVHNYGEVWDLAWFPLDAYEHSESETFLTRIGLLGAACQDGTIKIWPICDPDELKRKHSLPLYKTHPKVILELEDKANMGCLRLAIGRTGTVVGGYAGGLVAVWNLKTIASPFCKTNGKSSILKPIVSFQAHKTSITALSMCQNSDRYICTSGLDRFIKFWDLECPGNPFESLQKEVCLDNVWPKHWPLTISTFEDIVPSSGKGMIKAVREVYCDKHRTPLALEGTCWSLSFNEWLNILCGCNNIGEVKIRFLRNMFLADETSRYRTGHVVCETELKFLKDYEKVQENVAVESCKDKSKKTAKKGKQVEEKSTAVPRTYEEAWKYFGLVFHDSIVEEDSKQKANPSKTSKKGNQCLEDYPITSVNKVCWNPNYKRFMQLAIGHHCGLIRIKPLKDSKSDEDVLRFLTESEDEIGKSVLE